MLLSGIQRVLINPGSNKRYPLKSRLADEPLREPLRRMYNRPCAHTSIPQNPEILTIGTLNTAVCGEDSGRESGVIKKTSSEPRDTSSKKRSSLKKLICQPQLQRLTSKKIKMRQKSSALHLRLFRDALPIQYRIIE